MRAVIMIVFITFSLSGHAQNWSEWFRQKKTGRKYLLEQIAALKVCLDFTRKGYEVANKGLGAIRDIKTGDLRIHTDYFESLKRVNPSVSNYVKVAGIIRYQLKITRQAKEAIAGIKGAATFSPEEVDYCGKVFDRLLTQTLENLDELTGLISSGNFKMKDDERLKCIDALYSDMQEMYGFCCSFSEKMALLSVQRLREKHDVQLSKALNDLK